MGASCVLNIKVKGQDITISEGELSKNLAQGMISLEDIVADKLDKPAIAEAKIRSVQHFRTGETTSVVEGNKIEGFTLQTLVESDLFTFRGRTPLLRKNNAEYKQQLIEEYLNQGMNAEEAEVAAQQELKDEKKINNDSLLLHALMGNSNLSYSGVQTYALTEFKETLKRMGVDSDHIQFTADRLGRQLTGVNGPNNDTIQWGLNAKLRGSNKNGEAKTRIMQNVTLKAKVAGTDKEITAHFDAIVFDSQGNTHVYNYKVSRTDMSNWSPAKKENYWHQMALMKQILAYNGVDITNTEIYFVPVRVVYNDDMSAITDVLVSTNDLFSFPNSDSGKKYTMVAQKLIPAQFKVSPVTEEKINRINSSLNHFFPNRSIKHNGIGQTVDSWIQANYGNSWYSNIRPSEIDGVAYELYLDDLENPILIKDDTKPADNNEIKKHVQEFLAKEGTSSSKYLAKLFNSIQTGMFNKAGITNLGTLGSEHRKVKEAFLRQSVSKYLTETKQVLEETKDADGNPVNKMVTKHVWELIQDPTLKQANIALFRNTETGQLDVIVLSDMNLRKVIREHGQENIMNSYIYDASQDTRGLINYKNNFGNIEALRAMVILNEILPSMQGVDIKLGELKVITTYGQGSMEAYTLEKLNKELYQESIQIVKKHNPQFKFKNNFARAAYVDSIEVLGNLLNNCLNSNELDENQRDQLRTLGIDNLFNLDTKEAKKVELHSILRAIERVDAVFKGWTPSEIIRAAYSNSSKMTRQLANIYVETCNALLTYQDINVAHEYKQASYLTLIMTQNRIPNRTYQAVTDLYTAAIDKISARVREIANPIMQYTKQFYQDQGFGSLRNSVIGDSARAFLNLYRVNERGERMMEFRNPYETDTQTPLNSAERLFLKRTLFQLAKIKSTIYGFKFDFNSAEDPRLEKFIKENSNWYFLVPLQRAASATRLSTSFVDNVKQQYEDTKSFFTNSTEYIDKYINGFSTAEEANIARQQIESLSVSNPFMITDGYTGNEESRRKILEKYPPNYWEINLENLMAEYIQKAVETQEYAKVALTTKALLVQLEMKENAFCSTDKAGFEQTKKLIKEFIQLNIYHVPIMEKTNQKILAFLKPLRSLVSKAYIAANITSASRDTMEGLMQNFMRALNHYQTDISAADLAKAYALVSRSMLTSSRNITLMDELCRTYRLSNVDVARISEALTTSRSGIMNFESVAYQTLRQPDFLNRMTLFVAQALKDGSWDAFSMKDGKLHYDWKKDKRYSVYADPSQKGTAKWKEQRAAYFNAIRAYNRENPENELKYTDDLPAAYSNERMQQIRAVSNSIYGAYDKSLRAKYESYALGSQFLMFSTWMNGIMANYLAKPGQYPGFMSDPVQERDASGNLLFLDGNNQEIIAVEQENEEGYKYYIRDTGEEVKYSEDFIPLVKEVPRVFQGIIYTFADMFYAFKNGDSFKEKIWNSPVNRMNLKKFGSDIFMALFYMFAVKLGLSAMYAGYKKTMKDHSFTQNALTEVAYNAFSRSFDGFNSIISVGSYFGENTNPPIYKLSTQLVTDLWKFMTGDGSAEKLAMDVFAPLRSFRATIRAEHKKNEVQLTPEEKAARRREKAEQKRLEKEIKGEIK